jgi:hypothetical protein
MDADEDAQAEDDVYQIHLTLSHLSALISLLQAIKIGSKQVRQSPPAEHTAENVHTTAAEVWHPLCRSAA